MLKLLFSSTHDANMLYRLRMRINDPFFYFETAEKRHAILNALEYETALEKSSGINLIPLEEVCASQSGTQKRHKDIIEKILAYILELEQSKTVQVPWNFPCQIVEKILKFKIKLEIKNDIFPQRKIKNSLEVKNIVQNIQKNEAVFKKIEEVLADSIIKKDKIIYKNRVLTSESLKKICLKSFLDSGLEDAEGLIISSGRQTGLAHHRGQGPIAPNSPIIVDLAPRSSENFYFSDITRTFVKGQPDQTVLKLFDQVKEAQEKAINSIKPGIPAQEIDQITRKVFQKYRHTFTNQGFIHSTGHGIGLEIHEKPNLSKKNREILREGNVFTVEPGLYYRKIGGVRLEDIVLVTKKGYKVLTNYSKKLIIK
ncbi:MAG: M24 family metallopeptidase [Candidatus Moranbacteria bacterium]|nr:M24 family metallopeptidase [Candidatus Moranbacteria bacterium]